MANQNNDVVLDISARLDKLIGDIQGAKKQFGGLKNEVGGVDKTIKGAVQGWQSGFAKFGLAINGVQQALRLLDRTFGDAVRTMASFQTEMTKVKTLLDITDTQFKQITKDVVELSKRIPQTADQLASGLYQVVSAGVDAGDALKFLETASKGAVAGITETEVAVDAITTVINAYGLEITEAEAVSDMFFQTVKAGKTEFGKMAPVMGQIIPVASAFGVPFEQIAGAFATMTKSGILTAQTATALSATINEMVKPASKAEKAIRKLSDEGLSGQEFLGKHGLQETIIQLTESGVNLAEVFGQEALKAVLALGKSSDLTREDLKNMAESAGSTEKAFREMNETLENQRVLLDNQMDALYLRLGTVLIPQITQVVSDLNTVLNQENIINQLNAKAGDSELKQLEAKITALDMLSAVTGRQNKADVLSEKERAVFNETLAQYNIVLAEGTQIGNLKLILDAKSLELLGQHKAVKDAEKLAIEQANNAKEAELQLEADRLQAIKDKNQAELDAVEAKKQEAKDDEELKKQLRENIKLAEEQQEQTLEELAEMERLHELRIRLNAEWEESEEERLQNALDRVDRLRELGTISTKDYLIELIKRRDAEEAGSIARLEIEKQIEEVTLERFHRLDQGFKEFLKGEMLDFITAKQVEMLATLGAIWAKGGLSSGVTLGPDLALYATGVAFLQGAKSIVTAFAEGGLIDGPTLALMGEAGQKEFVAPEVKFDEYSEKTLTPMIMGHIEAGMNRDSGNGMLSEGLLAIEKSVDNLARISSARTTLVSGDQIVQITSRRNRGRL
jgi:TP901 family phage tail tape measure protein